MGRKRKLNLRSCESCNNEGPIEDAVYSEGCYFCQKCWAEWKAEFDACEHDWTTYHNEHGDPGKVCNKCSGFVRDEDMADLFPAAVSSPAT